MAKTVSERLIQAIRDHGYDVPDGAVFHSTHAGIRQREQGAWVWYIHDGHYKALFAGYESASDLVKRRHDLVFTEPGMAQRWWGDRSITVETSTR